MSKNSNQIQKNEDAVSVNFAEVVSLIRQTHQEVLYVANKAMVDLYWKLGRYISKRVSEAGWGKNVVADLAQHIAVNLPESKGYSASNLWRMKQFYEMYVNDTKLAPLVREISWSNNLIILARAKSETEREFYLKLAIDERLSKENLIRQFKACVFERSMLNGSKLAPVLREIAPEAESIFKDQYVLE